MLNIKKTVKLFSEIREENIYGTSVITNFDPNSAFLGFVNLDTQTNKLHAVYT